MGQRLQQLLEAAGYRVTRWGEVGWTADRWISDRWNDVLAQVHGSTPPSLIIYVLGTNDIYRSDRTRPAAVTLRDVGPETWFIGAPSYASTNLTARVNATKPIFQDVFGSRYIDSRPYTAPNCAGRMADCVHFVASSGAGRQWATSVFNELQRRRRGLAPSGSSWGPFGIAVTLALGLLGAVIAFRNRRAR